jgi:glycosyltransferase involved in cell wall biosynthesis
MNLALYYPWIYLQGGAERLILEMVQGSRHTWTIFTNHYEPENTFAEFAGLNVVALRTVSVRRSPAAVAHALGVLATQRVDLRTFDGLVVVSEGLGNFFAPRDEIPRSCICLTPLKVVYDPVTRERFFGGRRRPLYRVALDLYRRAERRMWRRYDRVFCVSKEVRRRVLDAALVDPERIEVLYPGIDLERFRPAPMRDDFFLVPGRIMWQKNLELAIAAWRRFMPSPASGSERLVIAGMVDEKSRGYLRRLRQDAFGRPDIIFIETPNDDLMTRLYQSCRGVVFTAANEDWGFVPVEAMASGKPVIATGRGGPLESIVDGKTGFLRPDQPDAFADALRLVTEMTPDATADWSRRARARAERFAWPDFVDRIDAHVNELAAKRVSVKPRELRDVAATAD